MNLTVFYDKQDIAAFASAHRLHLALGYFDGVHLGHQALLGRALEAAKAQGGEAGVLLLEPHPQKVLQESGAPRMITPLGEKIRWKIGRAHV